MSRFVKYNGMDFYIYTNRIAPTHRATFVKLNSLDSEEFIIPETIYVDNQKYIVTSIKCDDFNKKFPAKSIFIPKTVIYNGLTQIDLYEDMLYKFFPKLEEIKTNLSIKDSYYNKIKRNNLWIGYLHNVNYVDFFIECTNNYPNIKLISFLDGKFYKENDKWKIKKQ